MRIQYLPKQRIGLFKLASVLKRARAFDILRSLFGRCVCVGRGRRKQAQELGFHGRSAIPFR
jgi:hypothetical protein